MMTIELAHRIIEGARAGSLVLTRSELAIVHACVAPGAVVIVDGNPRPILAIAVHLLPDSVDALPLADEADR